MQFRYIGEAPNGFIVQYDVRFTPQNVSEVVDPWAISKLLGNRFFEPIGDVPDPATLIAVPDSATVAPKRRGRPPKLRSEGE